MKLLLYSTLLISVFASNCLAADLTLNSSKSNNSLQMILGIDKVDKLAGLKVAISYPKEQMKLKSTQKLSSASSFLHVINDKIPGKLIVVMASAKGISGSNIDLITFSFALTQKNSIDSATITTSQCQLMNEDLQKIPCTVGKYSIDL